MNLAVRECSPPLINEDGRDGLVDEVQGHSPEFRWNLIKQALLLRLTFIILMAARRSLHADP